MKKYLNALLCFAMLTFVSSQAAIIEPANARMSTMILSGGVPSEEPAGWECSVAGFSDIDYVDTDVVGGDGDGTSWANAYSSLSAWEDAEEGVLSAPKKVCVRGATDDTTQVYISGWTTSAANYIEIEGDMISGVWDDDVYTINLGDERYGNLRIREEYVRVSGIQLTGVASGANANVRLYVSALGADNDVRLSNLLVTGSGTTSSIHNGMEVNDSDINLKMWNVIFYNFPTTTTYGYGIYLQACNTFDMYNSVVTTGGEYYGIRDSGCTSAVYNSAIFNNSNDDIRDIDTVENCATDQGAGEGTSGVDISGTWDTADFTNQASGDYSIQDVDSALYEEGQSDPGGAIQDDTDITGTSWNATYDIGAFAH